MENVVFRADANTRIGTGHIMRCLALAQHWRDAGGHSVFATCMSAPSLEARLKSEGMDVIQFPVRRGGVDDAKQTIDLAKKRTASWIVVDGYHFDASYQQIIKNAGLRLLLIDDLGSAGHCYADIVLNQNLHAHEKMYMRREPYTRLLLGTRYVLLRAEFLKWQGFRRQIPETAQKILVTLGGSDPDNVASKVIGSIQQVKADKLEMDLVCANNSHYKELESVARNSSIAIRLKRNVTNMPDLMAWSDVALSAGGTTAWELAFMGVPMLVMSLADNQDQVVEQLSKVGAAINLGWHENLTCSKIAKEISKLLSGAKTREELSRCAQDLVDGNGASKVLGYLKGW